MHVVERFSLISSTFPISLSLPSSCSSCCLTPSTFLMSWITSPRTSAEELGHPDENNASTCCGSKKWRWLILWTLKSSRSVYGKDIPNSEMLDAKIASALNKIIQNSQFKKRRSASRSRKPKKEGWFFRGRQNRLHDLRLLSSDWCSWFRIRLCFFLCHSAKL